MISYQYQEDIRPVQQNGLEKKKHWLGKKETMLAQYLLSPFK